MRRRWTRCSAWTPPSTVQSGCCSPRGWVWWARRRCSPSHGARSATRRADAFPRRISSARRLPLLPIDAHLDYRAAAAVYRAARRRGRTVHSLVDCLIAVVATRTGTALVHRDRNFGLIAECLPDLRLHPL
ncbi:MAG: PIN domain-containing protein [Pseudonocardiaceae bacterium]